MQLPDLRICGLKFGPKREQPLRKKTELEDGEHKETIKNARRKLEVLMEAAMHCKKGTKKRSSFQRNWSEEWWIQQDSINEACVHCGSSRIHKKAFGIISIERSWRSHCRQWFHFDEFLSFGAQIIPMLQVMKIPDAKEAVDKEWKRLETILAWKLGQVKSKEDVILEAEKEKRKVHTATLMDTCHLKNAELEPKCQRYKGRVCTPRWRFEPNDEEFKLTMKAARKKLVVPMPAAMPCKILIKSSGQTHR